MATYNFTEEQFQELLRRFKPSSGFTMDQLADILGRTKVSPLEIIGMLRRYDGRSDVGVYLSRLEVDLVDVGYDKKPQWLINNLDRVLFGDALTWWDSNYMKYQSAAAIDGDKAWTQVKSDMVAYFRRTPAEVCKYCSLNKKGKKK